MSLRLSSGRRLRSPEGSLARPTAARVRLAVMNLLASELPGCRWLDLCSGSGVMACEALQRGARQVVAVERDRRMAAIARSNLEAVLAGILNRNADPAQAPQVLVQADEVVRWLARGPGSLAPFDLIYGDPPYASGLYDPIGQAVSKGKWLRPGGTMVWECAASAPPAVPPGWICRDERRYGSCGLLLLKQDQA